MKLQNLEPGDILLIKGRRLRSWLSRLLSSLKWNHAVLYYGRNEVQELRWGGARRLSLNAYRGRQVVVLRHCSMDALAAAQRTQALQREMNRFETFKFDWVAFITRVILHLRKFKKKNQATCDEYVEKIYASASKDFADYDKMPALDMYDIMKNDYSSYELGIKYKLTKVYDYRDK